MNLTPSTKIHELLDTYPFMLDFLTGYNPKFQLLKKRVMRMTVGRMATVKMAASMADLDVDTFLSDIRNAIRYNTGSEPEIASGSTDGGREQRIARLKEIIRQLHEGGDREEAKRRFDEILGETDPGEIVEMEESLIRGGLPAAEVQRLCDLHVGVFKESLEGQEEIETPPGHPVHTFMQENQELSRTLCELDALIQGLVASPSLAKLQELKTGFSDVLARIASVEEHYQRKENRLFPLLEKHGITGPPQVMWGVHDEIRKQLKDLGGSLMAEQTREVVDLAPKLSRSLTEMIFKENKILYPMALGVLTDEEWESARNGNTENRAATAGEKLGLQTGQLFPEQIDLLLTHLPLDVTFVDENDAVRYYSSGKERLFPRSPEVIGRKVQLCHPPKSVDTVNRILDAFRRGEKDVAEFWLERKGRFIHIRYFAVRDGDGKYRGTLEVSQDVTAIRKLKGERRLLDWEQDQGGSDEIEG